MKTKTKRFNENQLKKISDKLGDLIYKRLDNYEAEEEYMEKYDIEFTKNPVQVDCRDRILICMPDGTEYVHYFIPVELAEKVLVLGSFPVE